MGLILSRLSIIITTHPLKSVSTLFLFSEPCQTPPVSQERMDHIIEGYTAM
jgi:hypothetical protein